MTMNIYNEFGTDENAEKEGVSLIFGEGVKMTVKRAGSSNKAFARKQKLFNKKYGFQMEHSTLDDKTVRKEMAKIYAETIVIGWEGFTDKKGKELPFTKEN